MLRPHPFLHIHLSDLLGRSYLFGRVGVFGLVWVVFKVGSEVLEQSDLFLQVFGVFSQGVSSHHVLLLSSRN